MITVFPTRLAHQRAVLHLGIAMVILGQALFWRPAHAAEPGPAIPDIRFPAFFSATGQIHPGLLALAGQVVTIEGHMVRQDRPQLGQFWLTARPIQMSEHADGAANDLPAASLLVRLSPEQANWSVPHQARPLRLTGLLEVGREEAADGQVSWFRLHLPSASVQAMSPLDYWAALQAQSPHRH